MDDKKRKWGGGKIEEWRRKGTCKVRREEQGTGTVTSLEEKRDYK